MHRPALLGWTVGVLALGTVMGAIAPGVGDLLDSEAGRKLIESIGGTGALEDSLLAAVLSISAVVITCFGIAVVARGGADEHDGRTEQVLATATSRSRSLLAALVVALGGVAWLLLATGLATGIGLGRDVGGLVEAALAQLPAVWLVVSLAALLYAIRSSWSAAAWGLLGLFLVVGQIGSLLELPAWVTGLSPYEHVPAMPVEPFQAATSLTLTALAACCLVAAWWRYRSRDIGRHVATRAHVAARARVARTAERHRDLDRGRVADRSRWPSGGREAARGACRDRPAELERPAALRVLAARRGRRHRAGRTRVDAGAAGAGPDLGRGGRRGDHPGPGLGRGRRQQRPVLRGLAGQVRRRRPG